MKYFEWAVVVTCQGDASYYKYRNLFSALVAFAYHYLTKHKYGTMNFTLRQVFIPEGIKWRNERE